jgi:glycosyltransferase involved in cell wall biosynthesis
MRVLFVARRCAPATGGVESYLQDVSRGLAGRHDVTVLAHRIDDGDNDRLTDSLRPPPTFTPFQDHGVSVKPLRFTSAQRMQMLPTVGRVVPGLRRYAYTGWLGVPMAIAYAWAAAPAIAEHARDADVIHVWADGPVALAAVRAARVTGKPILVTPFLHRMQWGADPVSVRAYNRADRVLGLLQDNCDFLRELGVPDARVAECQVCSPGVEPGHGADWRRTHGVEGPMVLFLGVRRPYKGFDVLVSALPELARRRTDVTVAFAGPGDPIRGEHQVRVIDRGRVDDAERAAIMEAADVLCLPSQGEIFPASILEAWSVGAAVVTSDIAPLAELMRRSNGGVAVPREPTALAAALADVLDGRYLALGAAGRDYWRTNCTVDAIVSRHVDLYEQALNGTAIRCAAANRR